MLIVVMVLVLGGVIGLVVNAGRKLFLWFHPLAAGIHPLAFGILYGTVMTAIMAVFVLSRFPNSPISRTVILADHYALGAGVYLVMFVNAADLVLLLLRLCHLIPASGVQRAAILAGAAALILSAGLSVYGGVHAASLQRKDYTVVLRETEQEPDAMRVALISDLHLGYVVGVKQVEKIVDAINASKPDLVCLAGDIFDGDITALERPEKLQSLFREMNAPYGVYACLGNHDAGAGYEGMLEFLEQAQIRLLQDEEVLIDGRILLAGRRDSSPIGSQGERRVELETTADTEGFPRIVLDHKPENIGEYQSGTDLILCGHTHKGQFFPVNVINEATMEVNYGYYRKSGASPQVIVTSGAGTWGPLMRVGSDSEVAVIEVIF